MMSWLSAEWVISMGYWQRSIKASKLAAPSFILGGKVEDMMLIFKHHEILNLSKINQKAKE